MDLKDLNVFQLIPRLKSNDRSDLSIRDFREINSQAGFYVNALVHQIPMYRR